MALFVGGGGGGGGGGGRCGRVESRNECWLTELITKGSLATVKRFECCRFEPFVRANRSNEELTFKTPALE